MGHDLNDSGRFHCGGARIMASNALGICTDTIVASTKKQVGKASWEKEHVPRFPENQLTSSHPLTWRDAETTPEPTSWKVGRLT